MVKIMENPIYKWMIWGYHYFWKHPRQLVDRFFLFSAGDLKSGKTTHEAGGRGSQIQAGMDIFFKENGYNLGLSWICIY